MSYRVQDFWQTFCRVLTSRYGSVQLGLRTVAVQHVFPVQVCAWPSAAPGLADGSLVPPVVPPQNKCPCVLVFISVRYVSHTQQSGSTHLESSTFLKWNLGHIQPHAVNVLAMRVLLANAFVGDTL